MVGLGQGLGPVVGLRSRKRKRGTPTYVLSLGLAPSQRQVKRLNAKFFAATRLHNTILTETLARSRRVKADPRYEAAKALPHTTKAEKRVRSDAFKALDLEYEFTDFGLQGFARGLRRSWIKDELSSHETQKLATSVYRKVHRYHLGLIGRPRYKSTRTLSRGVGCLEAKQANSTFIPKVDARGTLTGLKVGKHLIAFQPLPEGSGRKHQEAVENQSLVQRALSEGRFVYARIVRKFAHGRPYFVCQFVVDGFPPPRHHKPVEGTRGCVDLGPSTAHIAHTQIDETTGEETWVSYSVELSPNTKHYQVTLRRLQRRLDRQHRAGSPHCFWEDGTHKKGVCYWGKPDHEHGVSISRKARATKTQISELHRKLAATRQRDHGTLANHLASCAADWSAEKLSYLGWQKTYPHSVKNSAPAGLLSMVVGKAERAGHFQDINPYATALSQHCLCGNKEKKPLSQRLHHCGVCGIRFHRDQFSAFLGLHTNVETTSEGDQRWSIGINQARSFFPHRVETTGFVWGQDALPRACQNNTPKRRVRRSPANSRRSVVRIRKRLRQSRCTKTLDTTHPNTPTLVPTTVEEQV